MGNALDAKLTKIFDYESFIPLRGAGAATIYPNPCGTIVFQVGAVAKDIVHKSCILTPMASGHTSEFFKGLTFADAIAAYRFAERSGLVRKTDEYIVIYHCEN